MKRYIINLMLAVAATACLTSCNDFLKEDPSSQIKEDEAYKNETELYLNAVAALYNNVGGHNDSEGLQGTARGVYDLNEFTTDEAILPTRGADWYDGGLWQNLFRHSWGTGTDCIGTGKYKVVSNDDTTEVVLEKFADYHDGEPALDKLVYKFIDDNNTKIMNFKNGDIDYCDLDASLYNQYKDDPDVKDLLKPYQTLGVQFVNLNLNSEKLKDVRVRQALSLAINRQELIDSIAGGLGEVPSGWLAPATPGYDKDAPAFEYNPDKAKQLLSEAGVSNLTLSAKVRSGINEKQLTAVQSYWDAIGVKLELTTEDNGVWQSDWAAGNLEITALGWFPLYADADNHMYTYFYSENAAKKSSFYNNPEFDKLVSEARIEQDSSKRADLYKQADNILTRTDYATLPLYWPKNVLLAKDYVLNAKVGNLIYHMIDVDIDPSKEDYKPEE